MIAVDAMGGDNAPKMVIAGAEIARKRHLNIHYLLFGDEQKITPLLAKRKELRKICDIHHTDLVINNEMKLSQALRSGRKSSMGLAIQAVEQEKAEAIISAGNTGVLMAMAKQLLKTVSGIDRPAITSFFPTQRSESVMLDLGANIDCDVDNLIQFTIMGATFAKSVLGILKPTIGLLNIGAEEGKGRDVLKNAASCLRNTDSLFSYHGFVEGNDILSGKVDVIVTDGFTGNVALKTAEGTAQFYRDLIRRSFRSSAMSWLGYLLVRPALHKLQKRLDPRRYNGGVLLGLQGVCVKSHGGTDAFGFANAISVAIDLITNQFNHKIDVELNKNRKVLPILQSSSS